MRKWTPRQPSPELHRRIFGEAHEDFETISRDAAGAGVISLGRFADLSRWLVPVLGCFLLVLASFSNHSALHEPMYFAGTNLMFPADHSDINSVPARHLESNFAVPKLLASPGASALLSSYTNKLIQ
ncbi:MAG TPA: hypothetical protein VGR78_08790 [Verrucomicrobiae bacterium]|jgi:hypothetical protein|nr:hypothetical protein [Verrucomicrobiae bacterium]